MYELLMSRRRSFSSRKRRQSNIKLVHSNYKLRKGHLGHKSVFGESCPHATDWSSILGRCHLLRATSLRGQLPQVRVRCRSLREQVFGRSKSKPGGQTCNLRRTEVTERHGRSMRGFRALFRHEMVPSSAYWIASAKPSVRWGTTRVGVLGTILSSSSKKCC